MSPATFLRNNDINITASCIDVDMTKDDLLTIDASDCFKAFVFQPEADRKIQTVNTVNTKPILPPLQFDWLTRLSSTSLSNFQWETWTSRKDS